MCNRKGHRMLPPKTLYHMLCGCTRVGIHARIKTNREVSEGPVKAGGTDRKESCHALLEDPPWGYVTDAGPLFAVWGCIRGNLLYDIRQQPDSGIASS